MPTIHINVKNRVATANGDSRIINGNSDYSIEFDFDAEWADLNNKIGIFAYNDAAAHKWAYQTVMFSGNTCTVPILRDVHCVYVGVTAGNVRVTTPAKVQCRLSISDYADTEEPPSADIWGQILAKLDELQTEIDEIKAGGVGGTDISLNVTGATVGQTIKVKAVDADGKPTAWEAVDMAAGNAEVWELINQIEIPVGAEEATAFTIDKDLKGSSFELERAQFFVYMPKYTGESTVPSFSFICVNGYYGGKIAPMIYTDILSPNAGNARNFVYLAEKDPQTGLWHESVKYEKINGSLRVGTMGGAGSYRDLYDCAGELIGVLHPITSIGIRQTIVYAGCKYWLYGVRK